MKSAWAILVAIAGTSASAAEVRITPGVIITNPATSRGYIDLVVDNVGVRADDGEQFQVEKAEIALIAGDEIAESRILSAEQLLRETGGLFEAPVPEFVDAQLLVKGGLTGFFGAPTTPSRTAALQPRTALVASQQYFATRSRPDAVRVSVEGVGADGKRIAATATVPVRAHNSPIQYRAPVSGTWLMQSIPSLQSHHRLNASTEFAVDFMKVDAEGRLYNGDITQADSFYGYGAPVMAAADGVVVRAIDGVVQDRVATTRRADETPQAAAQRIGMFNLARMKSDFVRAVAGNLVVIRHEKNGTTEYSAYGHLRNGLAVREGQAVKQGEVIGQVGDTGDTPTVHLHFQVNAGADPFSSPSLPVAFGDVKSVGGNTDVGRFVTMGSPPGSQGAH